MSTWRVSKITGQFTLVGRGVLLTFIPFQNKIFFSDIYPFKCGDLMLYNGKEYPIIGIQFFPTKYNNDHELFGFLIKEI